jgi:4-hydroxy-3-methylbut-2-enyl diphosphate reductase
VIVKRAAVMGRCMGVKRAVDMALAAAAEEGATGVFTLGPLIHNPQAVADLDAAGVHALSEADLDARDSRGVARVAGKTVVIRAHGVPPALRDRLSELGARVVDATCPRVLASQRKAAVYAARGWKVVIAGDEGHGEVVGIAGQAPGAVVVGGPEEARAVEATGKNGEQVPVVLIAQTTIKKEEYEAIRAALAERFSLLEVVDSICPCTEDRIRALTRLAAEVEAIVIVGGRNSANTARLLATARELVETAWLVETAAELPEEVFGFARIGLSAGASTPERLIAEVEDKLLRPRG